jgi:hypothetical protein
VKIDIVPAAQQESEDLPSLVGVRDESPSVLDVVFWAQLRWAISPAAWGAFTVFSFSSILREQYTQTATLGMSHLR